MSVLGQTSLVVFWLQGQETGVNEQTTIAIFWQPSQKLGTGKVDLEELGHWHHQRVGEPLGELVERYNVLPGVGGVRWHDGTRPRVANGYAIDLSSCCRPDGCQAVHEGVPESGHGDDWHRRCLRGGMRQEVV